MVAGRFGWATDIHLNFVNLPRWDAFVAQVHGAQLAGLLLTGDVSEAEDVAWQLQRIASELRCPIYFVLGNHDFYHGSIARVRHTVRATCVGCPPLHYLTDSEPIRLTEDWILCGDDGWADGRVGDYFRSPIRMNDFSLISDLIGLDAHARYRVLRRKGAASAMRLSRQLRAAASLSRRILVLTHIPPFRESCWYEGGHSDDNWAPFFICHSVGHALRRFCRSHPQHEMLVLCGHTHHGGRSRIAENLTVWTGRAEYGRPELCDTLELQDFRYPANDWTFT